MRPTLPEDRELREQHSEVFRRYRAGSGEVPSARLDAVILAAARREVEQYRRRRNWHRTASIAAVLVIGVSLALMTSEVEDPLPPLDQAANKPLKIARPAAPELAMKTQPGLQPAQRPGVEREARPSRERSARSDRAAELRQEAVPAAGYAGSSAEQSISPPVAPPALRQFEADAPAEAFERQKALTDAAEEQRAASRVIREESAAASAIPARTPEDWLAEIEKLLSAGETGRARQQLTDFRKRYPDYRLPERLRTLEAQAR